MFVPDHMIRHAAAKRGASHPPIRPHTTTPQPDITDSGMPWRILRAPAPPGTLRAAVARAITLAADSGDSRPLIFSPNQRWVLEPHAEHTLVSVLDSDSSLAAVVGWWRWTDPCSSLAPPSAGPATVRVGGSAGNDLSLIDLLQRPLSVGPIAIRSSACLRLEALRDSPADAVLDAASTWAIACTLIASGARVASIPRICAARTRTVPEDPEALRPIGLAWLVQHLAARMNTHVLDAESRRELFARWRAAPRVDRSIRAAPFMTRGATP